MGSLKALRRFSHFNYGETNEHDTPFSATLLFVVCVIDVGPPGFRANNARAGIGTRSD
jgi:hypothetical protein